MKKIKKTNLTIKFSLLLISILLFVPNATGAWDGKNVPIINILPTDGFRPFHAANPEKVQTGILNAIDDESAIIEGKHMKISSSAALLTWKGEPKKRREFVAGSLVGFEADESGHILILWDLNPDSIILP